MFLHKAENLIACFFTSNEEIKSAILIIFAIIKRKGKEIMCGRYTNSRTTKEDLDRIFGVSADIPDLKPRYNVAPSQMIDVVVEEKGERFFTEFKWGLVPVWAKPDFNPLINARGETLAEKPSFKNAFKSRRCIIPADGFYEWEKTPGGKQPHYFFLKDKVPFGFAGIYENWTDKESGEIIQGCAIITTEANEVLEPIHDRMPVILKPNNFNLWLDEGVKDTDKLQKLLIPYPSKEMDSYMVSKAVNAAQTDSEEMIKQLNSN